MPTNTKKFVIRPLRESDNAQWKTLWTGYLDYYETSVTDEVYQSTFARLIADDPLDFNGLVADQNGTLIGLTHYLFHRHCWKIENTCYLQDLYSSPEMRGQGIGRALIEAVYKVADENNAPAVYWLTQDFNAAGRRLYDKVGSLTPFIKYARV